jgi:acylphosphatase
VKAVIGVVSGKVQRVWYRRSVQEAALAIGLTGYARNLPDGRVEVLLCGSEDAIRRGKEAVLQGSPASRVDDIQWQEQESAPPSDTFRCL